MKTLKYTYLIVLAALTAVMAACSSDEDTVGHASERADEKVPVRLHLRVAGQSNTSSLSTRATWSDENATDDEMMNMWVVIAVHAEDDTNTPKQYEEGDVVFIHASIPETSSREIDDLVYLLPGNYHFYSFANIDLSWLGGKGIIGYNKFAYLLESSEQVELPMYFIKGNVTPQPDITYPQPGEIYNISFGSPGYVKYHDISVSDYDQSEYDSGISTKTIEIDGNGFNPTIYDPDNFMDNGFGSKGIPMSNVQQNIEVTGSDDVDLIVVRMMAKIKLQIKNETGVDITVKNAKLSNITANSSATFNDNLLLLPDITAGANTMNFVHKDIKPNLGGEAVQADYTQPINKTIANGETEDVVFYINESATPSNSFGLFYLTLEVDKGGGSSEFRYALISQKGATSDDDNAWDYIARNDYRIIPIVLDDYKMDLIPYDFPPIGVYPASVKEEDGLFTINFHDYGHFHLVPTVTKLSDNTIVPFTATTPDYSSTKWGLVNNDFNESWGSWIDATKTTAVTDDGSFYRNGTESYITTVTDGDDVGGFPKWYANTSSPQWDPAGGTNYTPFIFGYIADPGDALTADRKVYHEFTFNLYKQGMTVPRQMTYRLMMILDTDQMMYSRQFGAYPATTTHRKRH